jgi:hypothetical protein
VVSQSEEEEGGDPGVNEDQDEEGDRLEGPEEKRRRQQEELGRELLGVLQDQRGHAQRQAKGLALAQRGTKDVLRKRLIEVGAAREGSERREGYEGQDAWVEGRGERMRVSSRVSLSFSPRSSFCYFLRRCCGPIGAPGWT